MCEESHKCQSSSEVTEEDDGEVDGDGPYADSTLHPGHGHNHEVGGTEVLTGQDEHDEADGEEEGGDEGDETGVVGS